MAVGSVSQAELRRRTLETMEDELRIPDKNAKDFVTSLAAVVEEAMANGEKVMLFGITTLTPTGVPPKPKRKGRDPRTGEERTLDAKPAGVKVRVSAARAMKDALPAANSSVGKKLVKEARERQKAAQERAEAREAEEQKAAAKASKAKGKTKKSSKKK